MLENGQRGLRQPQSYDATAEAKQGCLRKRLSHKMPACGAQRKAQSCIALPCGGSREMQTDHIGAGNEPEQTNSRHQRQGRFPLLGKQACAIAGCLDAGGHKGRHH